MTEIVSTNDLFDRHAEADRQRHDGSSREGTSA